MGKCVIERPRGNSSAPSAKARDYGRFVHDDDGIDYDGLTRLPVSKKQEGYHKKLGEKSFSDVLGPLENYLRSSCGRPWNDVYSEIARFIGRGAGWGVQHILKDHVDVAVNTYRGVDGNVYDCSKHGVERVGGYNDNFYVEPETGILRASAPYRKWRSRYYAAMYPPKPVETVTIDAGREYRKIKGIWYYHEWAPTKVWRTDKDWRGNVIARYEDSYMTLFKRQLSRKTLRLLKLRNH